LSGAPTSNVQAFATDGSLIVATGTSPGLVWSEDDGLNWVGVSGTATITAALCVVRNNGIWVAGGTSLGYLWRSVDGKTWTTVTGAGFTTAVNSVRFGNGVWVAVGRGTGGNTVAYSTNNAVNWTMVPGLFTGTGGGSSIHFRDNVWIISGERGAGASTLYRSTDGINWVASTGNVFVTTGRPNNGGGGIT